MAQITYGSITVSDLTDGKNANIWTTTVAPTTPNYTFNISNLTGSNDDPREGDIILYSVYRYTISSISATTVLAGNRQSLKGAAGTDGGKWYSGTGITGTSTTATIFNNSGVANAIIGDMYLNTSTNNTYRCTVAGASSVAKWVYVNNIKGSQGTSVTKTETEYYRKLTGGQAPQPSTTGSTTIPEYVDGCTYYTRTVTYLSVGDPVKGDWLEATTLTNQIKDAYEAWIAAGAVEQKAKSIVQDSSGVTVAAGINGADVTPGTTSTYGYNTIMAPTYLGLRYNAINLVKLTTTESTPELQFYFPSFSGSSNTPVQGDKGLTLGTSGMNFYHPGDSSNADVTLNSNGLIINNGAIQFGSGGASGTSAGNIRLANVDFNRSINDTNRTNLRLAIGSNFGVVSDGTLYASNVDISGKITASDGEIGGFAIDSSSIHTKNVAITSNADSSVGLSSSTFTRTINGTSRSNLKFAIGSKFGVASDGTLYSSGLDSVVSRVDIAETSLGDKVDTSTFNTLSQTVDGNSASITELSTITTNNGLTKTTNITNTVNTVSQTATGNSSKISSLTNTLGTNADGTTKAGDIVHRTSAVEQDLSGFKTTVSNTYQTKSDMSNYYTKTQADSAIEQKASEISLSVAQTEISKIEVGGRNYVKDSQDIPLKDTATANSNYYTLTVYHNDTAFEIGDVLTASANVEVLEGSVSRITFYLYGKSTETNRSKSSLVTVDIVNGKAVAQLTLNNHYGGDGNKDFNLLIYQGVWGQTAGNRIKLTNVKLEKGNKATDWTPAPEDVEAYTDTQVSAAKAEIKVTTDGISTEVSKKVGSSEIISKINQSAEMVKIEASRVEIDGTATFNAIKSSTDAAYDAKGAASAAESNAKDYADGAVADKADKSNAVARTQRIYYRKTSSGAPSANKTWLATSGTGYGNWSLKVPQMTSGTTKYPYLYTAVQTQTVAQMAAGNACSCSAVLLDDTTTVIDGGHITTGTIDTNRLNADTIKSNIVQTTDLNASKITSGDISADRMKVNSIAAINSLTTGKIDAARINVGQITVGSLSDGSSYSTTTQMKTAIGNAVDDIEVGGRNLVWDTEWKNISTRWSDWGSPTTREIVTIDGKRWLHIVTTTTRYQGYSQGQEKRNGYGEIKAGDKVVVSFFAYAAAANQKACVGIHWRNSSGTIVGQNWGSWSLTTTAQRYTSPTFTVPNGAIGFNIMIGDNTDTTKELWISEVKMEFGNKATDWSPAPEDVQAEIDAKKSVHTLMSASAGNTYANILTWTAEGYSNGWLIDVAKTPLTGIKVGDTCRVAYKVTDMDNAYVYVVGEMTSISGSTLTMTMHGLDTTIIDGGNILTNSIGANQLNVTNINASKKLTVGAMTDATKESILNSEIEIGGKNLLRHTASPTTNDLAMLKSTIEDGGIIRVTPTTGMASAKFKVDYLDYADFVGKTLTVSADARLAPVTSEYTSVSGRLYLAVNSINRLSNTISGSYDRCEVKTFSLTSDWQRVSFSVQIPDGLNTGTTDALVAGSQITVQVGGSASVKPSEWRHIKLEIGNKATDWTSAEEDYITDIDGTGIRVHTASTENNSVHIDANGVYILKGGTDKTTNSIAFYGDTARVGKSATRHIEISAGGLKVCQDDNASNVMAHIGYGPGNTQAGGTEDAPYFVFGELYSGRTPSFGNFSFTEGRYSEASGFAAHAEGCNCIASGKMSHAEGYWCEASGQASHASGFSTTAAYTNQFVIGQNNANNANNVFEIGGGEYAGKNIFEVDWDGNVNIPSDATYKVNGTDVVPAYEKEVFYPDPSCSARSYSSYDGCYYEKFGRVVHVHVGVADVTSTDMVIYTLPSEYRPSSVVFGHGTGGAWNNLSYVDIRTDGKIHVRSEGAYCGADITYIV